MKLKQIPFPAALSAACRMASLGRFARMPHDAESACPMALAGEGRP